MASTIKRLYFNPKVGAAFSGLNAFYSNRHLKLNKKEVEKELLKLKEYYLYRSALRKLQKRRFLTYFPHLILCADLIDLQRYKDENSGYRYILLVIDRYQHCSYSNL